MYSGYIHKRNMPISPPSMQKVFSVLWGTLLLDYDNEEDSKTSLSPKTVSEVLGISEWDGQGRANHYHNGFLIVTHTGMTYYCSAASMHDRNEWIIHVKRALECNFANPDIIPFKPSKIIQSRPSPKSNPTCPRTRATLSSYHILCNSCGRSFSSHEYVNDTCIFLQLGSEEIEKCCNDCKSTQIVIIWLKTLNYYHITTLHEHTPTVVQDVMKFKASFKLRRRISTRLDMAAALLENKQISLEEFDELRRVDHEYRRELIFEESGRLHEALDTIDDDMQMIIDLLLNPSITERGGRMSYYQIIKAILVIADEQPELIDFYWPQLIHVHFIESSSKSSISLMKVDLFQQMLLAIAQRYPTSLAIKLAWSLLATIGDYHSPTSRRVSQRQYGASMSLLLQLEHIITGVVSSICDIPMSKLLSRTLIAAPHQQQELAFELGILCLVRRQLQELYDEEEVLRMKRNETRGLELASQSLSDDDSHDDDKHDNDDDDKRDIIPTTSSSPASSSRYDIKMLDDAYSQLPQDKFRNMSKRHDIPSCVQYFLRLGVDQASSSSSDDIEPSSSSAAQHRMMKHWPAFANQLDCFDAYTSIAEMLRFVDRPIRTQTLRMQLQSMIDDNKMHLLLGWDPIIPAGGPSYRIIKIEIEECRVFRTKARAPTLIICHIRRESNHHHDHDHHTNHHHHSMITGHSHGHSYGQVDIQHLHTIPAVSVDQTRKFSISIDEVDGLVESNMSQALANIQKLRLQDSVNTSSSLPDPAPSTPSASLSSSSKRDEYDSGKIIRSQSANTLASSTSVSSRSSPQPDHQPPPLQQIQSSSSSKRSSFVASHRKSVNFFSLLESVSSTDDLPRSLTTNTININTPSSRQPPLSPSPIITRVNSANPNLDMLDPYNNNKMSIPSPTSSSSVLSSAYTGETDFLMEIVEVPIFPDAGMTDSITSSTSSSSLSSSSSLNAHHPLSSVTSTAANMLTQTSATNTALVTRKVYQSAQKLLLAGKINQREYNELILSDFKYRHASAKEEDMLTLSKVENSFGESWNSKKDRLLGAYEDYIPSSTSRSSSNEAKLSPSSSSSLVQDDVNMTEDDRNILASINHDDHNPHDNEYPVWDLRAYIIKSNDDLRQEMCCLQIMQLCHEIFHDLSLHRYLWLHPYRITAVSNNTGIVEVIPDTISIDGLKKTSGFTSLSHYFNTTYGSSAERLLHAKQNFASSLAAYSLFCHILAIKDRHNGNMLLDAQGHIIHIDFGFILSIAPGGSFSVESAPFKLTEEMVDVLGGLESPLFGQFVKSFTVGFLALRSHIEVIISCLNTLAIQSSFPCFAGKDASSILDKVRSRFRQDLNPKDFVRHCLDLIVTSYGHYGTKQYDSFQWYTNGILP